MEWPKKKKEYVDSGLKMLMHWVSKERLEKNNCDSWMCSKEEALTFWRLTLPCFLSVSPMA